MTPVATATIALNHISARPTDALAIAIGLGATVLLVLTVIAVIRAVKRV